MGPRNIDNAIERTTDYVDHVLVRWLALAEQASEKAKELGMSESFYHMHCTPRE